MLRHLVSPILIAYLVIGMIVERGLLRAEPHDSQKTSPTQRSVPPTSFALSSTTADPMHKNQPRSVTIDRSLHEQLKGEIGRIEGPSGWETDYDPKEGTMNYFPETFSKDLIVNITVFPKLPIEDPTEAMSLPVQLHDQLMKQWMDGCLRRNNRTEGPSQSVKWGPIVHSTFTCLEQDGKRYSETLFTIKSTIQKQLVVLTSDEAMHQALLPVMRTMLQPIVDNTAPIDHRNKDTNDGTTYPPESIVLFAKSGSDPVRQLLNAPETAAFVDLGKVINESEIGKGFLVSMQVAIVERQKHIAQLNERIAARKSQASNVVGDKKKAMSVLRQIAVDEGTLLAAETELNTYISKTYLEPFKSKVRVIAAKLAQEFGLAAVVEVGASLKGRFPKATDLTDLTIANMTVASLGKESLIVRIAPEKKPTVPSAAPPRASDSLSQDQLFRFLLDLQQQRHETTMSIIRGMGPSWKCDSSGYCYRY